MQEVNLRMSLTHIQLSSMLDPLWNEYNCNHYVSTLEEYASFREKKNVTLQFFRVHHFAIGTTDDKHYWWQSMVMMSIFTNLILDTDTWDKWHTPEHLLANITS